MSATCSKKNRPTKEAALLYAAGYYMKEEAAW